MAKPNVVSKQDLIEAAKSCIAEHGMEKLTLKTVAEKANVTQGTVYYHFHTKNQLMLDVVKDVCQGSWNELSQTTAHDIDISVALQAAKERCGPDSFYHRLFLSLVVSGFTHQEIRQELGQLIAFENSMLSEKIRELVGDGPDSRVMGISPETWAVIMNAIIDGLAVQSLVSSDFDRERTFAELAFFFQQVLKKKQPE
ncbi:TetR/AcrR family transcriptional regulator [Brevibacillus migulae]|uniref:TetR/AcrR family transcriptional regulator n=1 Tax=Brevibacillus migulae TaxID=1644114 RepID=UPI00106EAC21|nr:TetR/AcrR family transcriptional regulator [Brevibacillus migulae]